MCVRSNCDIRSLTREQKVVSFIKVEKRLKDLEWNTKKYLCQRPVTSFARGRGQLQMLIALGAAGGAAVDPRKGLQCLLGLLKTPTSDCCHAYCDSFSLLCRMVFMVMDS